jgi:1-acyl-sn-glycerol-3-phosphate acyltransferase
MSAMVYLRISLVIVWMLISFGIGFLASLFRWGDINLNQFTAGLFGRTALKILDIRLEKEGFQEVEKHQPCIYVANHQGALDILTFGTIYPRNSIVIAKKEIAYIPILNLYYMGAGNILIDRQKQKRAFSSLAQAAKSVKEKGASVWLFPEGTRNRHRDREIMLPLKKGAFHLAVEAQVPIVPIVSGPISHVIDWKKKILKPGVVRLKALPPIETRGLTAKDVEALAEKTRSIMIEAIRGLPT